MVLAVDSFEHFAGSLDHGQLAVEVGGISNVALLAELFGFLLNGDLTLKFEDFAFCLFDVIWFGDAHLMAEFGELCLWVVHFLV